MLTIAGIDPDGAGALPRFGINNASAQTITISAPVTLSNAQTWTTASATGGSLTVSGAVTNGANMLTLDVGSAAPMTLSGVIGNGTGGITKTGLGTLTLSANNSYQGATTISGGILAITSLANGGANSGIGRSSNAAANLVLDGGTLRYTGAGGSTNRRFTIGTAGGTLDASGAGALTFSNVGSHTASGTGNRTLTLTGSNTAANLIMGVIANPGTGATSIAKTGTGSWVLAGNNTYTGTTTITQGTLAATGNANALGTGAATLLMNGGTLQIANNSALNLARNTTVAADSIIVSNRTANGAGLTHTLGTLSIGTQQLEVQAGSFVTSGTAGLTFGATTLTGNATFDVGANALLTLGGLGDGTTARTITKEGAGTLTLGTAATSLVNGTAFNISAGTVNSNQATALGTLANVTLSGGATLNLGATQTIGGLNGAAGSVTLGANTLTIGSTNNLTSAFGGVISGTGGVTKSGTGTLTLSGANTYSGVTTINAGVLQAATMADGLAASSIGQSSNLAANLVLNGGTLRYTGDGDSSNRRFTIGANGGTIDASGSGALAFTNTGAAAASGTGARTLTLTGSNAGSLATGIVNPGTGATSVTKAGSGTWTLSGNSTFTGTLALDAGTLRATTNANALGAGTLLLNGGTLELADNAGLNFGRNTTVAANTTIVSDRTSAGSGVNHSLGTLSIGAHNLAIGVGANSTAGTAGITFGSSTLTANSATFTPAAGANLFLGALSGEFAFTKDGAGALVLASAATRSTGAGSTTVNAGSLQLGHANALSTGTGTALNLNGGTLHLAPLTNTATTFAGTATTVGGNVSVVSDRTSAGAGLEHTLGTLSIGANTLSTAAGTNVTSGTAGVTFGATTLTGNATLAPGTANLTLGTVSETGGARAITVSGTGNLILTGANSFTGGTTINSGNVTVNSGAKLAADSGALTMNGGALNLNNTAQGVSSLSGSAGTINLGSGHTLTVNNTASNSFSGVFAGSGNLTKTGTGTLTLFGNSSGYSGTTTLGGGVMNVRHDNALGTGNATIAAGSTLQLQGSGLALGNGAATVTVAGAGTGLGGNNAAIINIGGGTTRLNNSLSLSGATTVSSGTTSGATLILGGDPPAYVPGVSAPDNDTISLNGNKLTFIGNANTTTRVDANIMNGTGAADVDINTAGTVHYYANKNSYTGATNLQQGTLIVDTANNAFAPNTPISEATSFHGINGTLNIGDGSGGANTAVVQLGVASATTNNAIKSTAAVNIASDGKLSLNGNIQNIGKLTMNGGAIDGSTGGLFLDYANTAVDVNLGGTHSTSTITGKLSLTFHKHAATEGTIPDYERVFNVGQTTFGQSDLTISGLIINGGLIKQGAGTMTLATSHNWYVGKTTVNNGVLSVLVGTQLPHDGQYRSSLGGGDSDGTAGAGTIVNSGGTLQLSGGIAITHEHLTLSGSGYDPAPGGADSTLGALNNLSGNNTWGTGGGSPTGMIALAGNAQITSTAGILNIPTTLSSTIGNNFGLTISGAGNTTITGSINTGNASATLTKVGTGTLTLGGNNGYQGATTISEGTVVVQHNRGLGANTTGADGTVVANGAELQLQNVGSDIAIGGEAITINGTGTSTNGVLRSVVGNNSIGGPITLGGNSLITANSGASLTLSGGIVANNHALTVGSATHNGNITVSGIYTATNGLASLTKNGSGSLTLSGGSSTVGTIAMNAGTMTISSGNTTANAVNVNGGTLNLNGTNTTTANVTVNGGTLAFGGITATTGQVQMLNGAINVGGSSTVNTEEFAANAGTTLTIATGGLVVADYSSGSTTFSGVMAGDGTFEKTGAGTLVFNNSFNATNLTLELNGGTLKLDSAAHITFDRIHITGNTVLDFSNSANTWLSSAILDIESGVQVTVINWIAVANNSAASTIWFANQTVNSNSLGATDVKNEAPFTQITFVDLGGPNFPTTWVAETDPYGYFDHEIRPTPEPETYGAILLSACFGLFVWRRSKRKARA